MTRSPLFGLRRTVATATLAVAAPALLTLALPAGAESVPTAHPSAATSPASPDPSPTGTAPSGDPTGTSTPSPSAPSPSATVSPSSSPSSAGTPTAEPGAVPSTEATTPTPDLTESSPAPAPAADEPAAQPEVAAAETPDQRMHRALDNRVTTARFGTQFSGTVIDTASNKVVWSKRATTQLMPASNAKLFTAAAALDTLGPDRTFPTYVRRGSRANHVVIVGGGDPLLTSRQLADMARSTKAWLDSKGYVNPQVYVDTYFYPSPSLAYGWKSSYVPSSVTPVRPLVRDNRDLMDTGADAGKYFAAKLRYLGIPGARYRGRQNVTSSRAVIASTLSVPVRKMVQRMVLTSDNDVAEILLRRTSYGMRNGTRWTGAKATQTEAAQNLGLPFGTLYDGSGLSRADRLSSLQIARLLDLVQDRTNPDLRVLASTNVVPTAGRTGTLKNRFTSSAADCAVGEVWAKTGTLGDAVSLSGWTRGADGRRKVFSFVVNGKDSSSTLKSNVDMLAATVNGCY